MLIARHNKYNSRIECPTIVLQASTRKKTHLSTQYYHLIIFHNSLSVGLSRVPVCRVCLWAKMMPRKDHEDGLMIVTKDKLIAQEQSLNRSTDYIHRTRDDSREGKVRFGSSGL